MKISRRRFLKLGPAAGLAVAGGKLQAANNRFAEENGAGCLVDTTLCIGCRACEAACQQRNRLPPLDIPPGDRSVFDRSRRPDDRSFTVVNRFPGKQPPGKGLAPETFCKFQCMHCLKPACVSACVSGALSRLPDGTVFYNPGICIGCRYCMIACPFQIPAYEYSRPLRPRVRKCGFCAEPGRGRGADPACVSACPTEALLFGSRGELLRLAHARIRLKPGRYVDRVYGEREAGGTSWLYLAGRPFGEIGLPDMPGFSPALRIEGMQHAIYRHGVIPLAFFGLLGGVMWFLRRRPRRKERAADEEESADG